MTNGTKCQVTDDGCAPVIRILERVHQVEKLIEQIESDHTWNRRLLVGNLVGVVFSLLILYFKG